MGWALRILPLAAMPLLVVGCRLEVVNGSTIGSAGSSADANSAAAGGSGSSGSASTGSGSSGSGGTGSSGSTTGSGTGAGCGDACPPGEVCNAGVCSCPFTLCTEPNDAVVCTDTLSDARNCSVCNHQCPPGDSCLDGSCGCTDTSPGCTSDAGLACCQGQCADVTSDPFNCGSCGVVCVSGTCLRDGGTGACECPSPPYETCGPDCFLPSRDGTGPPFCTVDGGIVCAGYVSEGEVIAHCSDTGDCWCPAYGGGKPCCAVGGCVDLDRDSRNCGGCGHVCPSGVCLATDAGGVCAP